MTSYTRLLTSAFRLVPIALLLVIAHSSLLDVHAQSASATLSGTVEDQNGAVVPNASVSAADPAKGIKRQATTNEQGSFTIPLLPPSTYTVTVESKGFAPVQIDPVILNVGDQKALQIQLKAGNISEMVKIEGEAPLINESAAVGTVVDRQFVANLPLNGRSFNGLIALTPGVVQTKANATNPGQFSVNGQRASTNYFTVDGVSANAGITPSINPAQTFGGSLPGLTAQGGTNNLVSIDALREFKVLTSSYAPEFGRTPGGQVSLVTRSGTNDFHGTLFDYFRNDVFDANDWFGNANRLRRPALRQNDFGGTFSGPVLLPRFGEGGSSVGYNGRNRTFFFFSYEGLRLRQPQVVSSAEVPSMSLRVGALERIRPFLNSFPVPNGPEFIDPISRQPNGLASFSASYSNPSTVNATSIRIDHNFSSKLTIFGRYNNAPSETIVRPVSSLNSPSSTRLDTQTVTLGSTLSLTSSIINEFRANYSRTLGETSNTLDNFGGASPVSDSQLFPSFASPDTSVVSFALTFSTQPQIRKGVNASNLQRQINLIDMLSLMTSTHSFLCSAP